MSDRILLIDWPTRALPGRLVRAGHTVFVKHEGNADEARAIVEAAGLRYVDEL